MFCNVCDNNITKYSINKLLGRQCKILHKFIVGKRETMELFVTAKKHNLFSSENYVQRAHMTSARLLNESGNSFITNEIYLTKIINMSQI